ncbi:hypothetical protein NLJ89_g1255 [Agrocybe chaxingu]|uniref:Uncharacterized protein n=1 Tax=Agrocybe chaxingu TaxID=84603 RepID=A0A9W8N0C9_9AGAR|nr:hypothetical protein NLJ89_g1255 [Agrocybe chaxingu]
MNDFGVQFQPVPRKGPIPRNVVGLIGGYYGENPTFVLSLNGVEMVIQAPTDPVGFPSVSEFDRDHPFYEWLVTERSKKIYAHYLEIVQALLGSFKFGETNWAYLVHGSKRNRDSGGYEIVTKPRWLPKVTCPPWAPLIHESEVEFTVYGVAGDRRGIWKGKEVDITYGWNEDWVKRLDTAMQGHKFLEGMDLTFEVYGHLINSKGTIIGIVTEAGWGRMATLGDRARIYQAISRVQRRGALYRACLTNRFMIANGKVRLLDPSAIEVFPPDKRNELERLAEYWHWDELDRLFHEIQTIGPFGDYRAPFARFTASYKDLECLPLPPSPEKPLGGIMLYPNFFKSFYVDPWPEYQQQESEGSGVVAKTRTRSREPLYIDDDLLIQASWAEDEDRPVSCARIQSRARHRIAFHPYRQRQKRDNFIAGSDATSVSSFEERPPRYAIGVI